MRHTFSSLALSSLLASCLAEPDVVVRLRGSDAGVPPSEGGLLADADLPMMQTKDEDAGAIDAATPPGPDAAASALPKCTGLERFVLVNKEGRIGLFDPQSLAFTDLGRASCLYQVGSPAIGLAMDGSLWAATPGKGLWRIDLDSLSCQQMPVDLMAIQALTFVFDPGLQRALLYALSGGTLFEVDQQAFTSSALGPLEARFLAGGVHGDLYAFNLLMGDALSIFPVDRTSAKPQAGFTTSHPLGWTPLSASRFGQDFLLAYDTELYSFDPDSLARTLLTKVPDTFPGAAAITFPLCDASTR